MQGLRRLVIGLGSWGGLPVLVTTNKQQAATGRSKLSILRVTVWMVPEAGC